MVIPWIDVAESFGLVVYAGWWAYDLHKGLVVRWGGMALRALYNILLFCWIELAATALLGDTLKFYKIGPSMSWVALTLFPVWALLLVIFLYSIRGGRRFAQHRLVRERSATGKVRINGLAAFPALWLLLALLQLGIEVRFLGGLSLSFPIFSAPIPGVTWWVLLGVGFVGYFVYASSLGLMAGFALAVRAAAREAQREGQSIPAGAGGRSVQGPPSPQRATTQYAGPPR
jgi:hypothetical protein